MYMYMSMYIYIGLYTYIYMLLICTYVCTDIYTHTHNYICFCLRVYIHAHVHITYHMRPTCSLSGPPQHIGYCIRHIHTNILHTYIRNAYILCIRYAVSRLGPFYESCVENDIHRKLIIHTQTHHVHPSDMHTCIHIYLTCSLAAGLPLQIGCGSGGPRSICARG